MSCRGPREDYTENAREFSHSLTRLRSAIAFEHAHFELCDPVQSISTPEL